jgi:hypothetical protein
LWAAIVAERQGYDRKSALTLGKALAGMNAQSKGRRLGVYHEDPEKAEGKRTRAKAGVTRVDLMGRRIPVVRKEGGVRAVRDDKPEDPAAIHSYLESKLGESLPAVRAAMLTLARSLSKAELSKNAYELYEKFRPKIPSGKKGWGAKGVLDLARLRALAEE